VRDIGRKGVKVYNCGPQIRNRVASLSVYSLGYSIYTSPFKNVNRFVTDIRRILSTKEYEMIIPIGADTTIPISYFKKELCKYTQVPVAD
jgi:hypothetical protein